MKNIDKIFYKNYTKSVIPLLLITAFFNESFCRKLNYEVGINYNICWGGRQLVSMRLRDKYDLFSLLYRYPSIEVGILLPNKIIKFGVNVGIAKLYNRIGLYQFEWFPRHFPWQVTYARTTDFNLTIIQPFINIEKKFLLFGIEFNLIRVVTFENSDNPFFFRRARICTGINVVFSYTFYKKLFGGNIYCGSKLGKAKEIYSSLIESDYPPGDFGVGKKLSIGFSGVFLGWKYKWE